MAASKHLERFLKTRHHASDSIDLSVDKVLKMLKERERKQEEKRRVERRRQRQNLKYTHVFVDGDLDDWEIADLGMVGSRPYTGEMPFPECEPSHDVPWCKLFVVLCHHKDRTATFKMSVCIDWEELYNTSNETNWNETTKCINVRAAAKYRHRMESTMDVSSFLAVARGILALKFANLEKVLRDLGVHLPGVLENATKK